MAMLTDNRAQLATMINQQKHAIASSASDRIFKTAYWTLRYGEQGRVTCFNDNLKNIDVFALSIRNGSPMIAETHVLWLRDLYIKLGMCTVFLRQAFQYMQEAALQLLEPAAAQAFGVVLERAQATLAYHDPLYHELIQHQDAIVELVVDNMYKSTPYWEVRYGEHGRASCMVDTYYNIAYVADAVGGKTNEGILIHTKWMRDFLITRGMCSRYYLEAWEELMDAMLQMLSPEHSARVQTIYQAVRANLTYDDPLAHQLANAQEQIIQQTTQQHYERDPQLQLRLSRRAYAQDIAYKLAYLVDAAVHRDASIFTNYIHWMREVALELSVTNRDIDASLQALSQALPSAVPANIRQLLQVQPQSRPNPHAQEMQAQLTTILNEVTRALHHPNTYWTSLVPPEQQSKHKQFIDVAITQAAQGFEVESLRPVLARVQGQFEPYGASRAYTLAFTQALRHSARQHLSQRTAQEFDTRLVRGLESLTDDDPALALLQIPDLAGPIIGTLRDYSPYWQVAYQRRSQASITQDVFVLIALLADDLMELTDVGFPAAADAQRQYLLKQGICTAYYQQVLDLTLDILQGVVERETFEQASLLLDAANAILESDLAIAHTLAERQDHIVSFVITHLQTRYPDWVGNYPGGWEDATTDIYYWLAYLSDTLTFNNPNILASHIAWLYDYANETGKAPETIRTTLVALGHAMKTQVPEHANALLQVMSAALSRLDQKSEVSGAMPKGDSR